MPAEVFHCPKGSHEKQYRNWVVQERHKWNETDSGGFVLDQYWSGRRWEGQVHAACCGLIQPQPGENATVDQFKFCSNDPEELKIIQKSLAVSNTAPQRELHPVPPATEPDTPCERCEVDRRSISSQDRRGSR